MMYKFYPFLFSISLLLTVATGISQEKKSYEVSCIAFYNLENLFDTINDPDIFLNEEFSPESPKNWNSEKYYEKLDHMAEVISKIGNELSPVGPAILGVSEIENRSVLEDLVKQEQLADLNYQIVHYNSPDRRGVDVGLIYQPDQFEVTHSNSVRLTIPGDTSFRSRDQLVVSGLLNGEKIHVIVNHWPSRRGGEKKSRHLRNEAGKLSRAIVDSLFRLDERAKIIVMGDLNDDPINHSVLKYLKAKGDSDKLVREELFNPYYQLYKDGIGTLAYRDSWNLFDQLIISQSLLKDKNGLHFYQAKVFNKNFLLQKEGRYKGYPLRTYVGSNYMGGFSDHFPAYIFLIKELE